MLLLLLIPLRLPEQVRNDIAEQLQLSKPEMLVGSFDRPNLVYRVRPRRTILKQVSGGA